MPGYSSQEESLRQLLQNYQRLQIIESFNRSRTVMRASPGFSRRRDLRVLTDTYVESEGESKTLEQEFFERND